MPKTEKIDWQELEQQCVMHFIKRLPMTMVQGKGVYIWDDKGNKYLDFIGGWAVNSLGHCHPVIVEALTKQAKTLIQASNQFYTIPQIELAKRLTEMSCFDKAFFANSGAEANEGAIKLARRYGKLNLKGAYQVITTHGSFHGRTLAMVAATGQSKFQEPYTPLPDCFINVDYNDVEAIKKATTDNVCAIMLEPIQGEGGVNMPGKSYLKDVRDWCNQRGILMILDEVQTGIGRLGSLFGYEKFGIEPDIITLAKGLGGGVPIGAILAKEKVAVFVPGEHGSTYGGNPLMCATALAVLNFIIKNELPERVDTLGKYFFEELNSLMNEFNNITEIKGMGLLIGLCFRDNTADKYTLKCIEKGLLLNAVKPNTIRFMPPYIINEQHIDKCIKILKEVLKSE